MKIFELKSGTKVMIDEIIIEIERTNWRKKCSKRVICWKNDGKDDH